MEDKNYLMGIVVEESAKGIDGKYRFVFMNTAIESDKNVMYVSSKENLSDEELLKRFAGTIGFEKIVRP